MSGSWWRWRGVPISCSPARSYWWSLGGEWKIRVDLILRNKFDLVAIWPDFQGTSAEGNLLPWNSQFAPENQWLEDDFPKLHLEVYDLEGFESTNNDLVSQLHIGPGLVKWHLGCLGIQFPFVGTIFETCSPANWTCGENWFIIWNNYE